MPTGEINYREMIKIAKQALLIIVYITFAYLLFMIVTADNYGKDNFDLCIERECERGGDAFCQKFRTINNCCLGANGKMAAGATGYDCVFK